MDKIGILTWHYYQNFGSALQCFALQTVLENLGKSVKVINYRNPKFGSVNICKENICYVFAPILELISERYKLANLIFRKKYIHETGLVKSSDEVKKMSSDFDVVIFGSDQIWAPNLLNPVYLGESTNKNVRKISYAASIGLNDIPEHLIQKYKKLLQDFYSISIREEEGKNLLKTKCGIDSTVVLDPTLLLTAKTYAKIQRPVKGIKKKYLFCYFLNKEHQYKEIVQKYAFEHNLQIVGVSDKVEDGKWMIRLTGLGADHFLWLVNNAETIMTDSYHGSIFSLLFHKNLWIFQRFAENNPICQNSRIRQLQNYFNLQHRVISATSQLDEASSIDYNDFEFKLNLLRTSSLEFLKNALI